jgi:benzoate/toluate 1,2-dioxygenase alpha subunit
MSQEIVHKSLRPAFAGNVKDLVRADRVHRSVYLDPEIFELEMQTIFEQSWLYVGHESQIPDSGDFVTLTLARKPVVLTRHRDGAVHVLFNRCGHRGAVVCNEAKGNAKVFRCSYHGWSFTTDGALAGVPMRQGYRDCVDMKDPQLGMVQLPRVASYQGFIFASFIGEGIALEQFLGPLKKQIDDLVALSPDNALLVTGGVHRYVFRGNWKHQLENLNDMYHPFFSHASTIREDGKQFRRRSGDDDGPQVGSDSGTSPAKIFDAIPLWSYPYGHSYCGNMPFPEKRSGTEFEQYRASLEARHGARKTDEILRPDWHNVIIYPNLCLQSAAQHIRVINPISVDRTEVYVFPILLKGAPDKLNRDVIKYLNTTHSAASMIQTDDLEAFQRIQIGLEADGFEWSLFARGIVQDREVSEGVHTASEASELPVRNQYRAWVQYLSKETL